jgi:hypothetical protein
VYEHGIDGKILNYFCETHPEAALTGFVFGLTPLQLNLLCSMPNGPPIISV